jgi:hypothetical protein
MGGDQVTCPRNCVHGYLGTDEIRDDAHNSHDEARPMTEGRIGMHLEFCQRVGQKTRVRLCKCQESGEKTEGVQGWRLE